MKHLTCHAHITSSYLTLNQVGRSCFHVYSAVRPFLRRSSHLLRDHGLNALPDGALTPVGTPLLHNRSVRTVRPVVSGRREPTSIIAFRSSVSVRMCTLMIHGEGMDARCGSSTKSTSDSAALRRDRSIVAGAAAKWNHPFPDSSECDIRPICEADGPIPGKIDSVR